MGYILRRAEMYISPLLYLAEYLNLTQRFKTSFPMTAPISGEEWGEEIRFR